MSWREAGEREWCQRYKIPEIKKRRGESESNVMMRHSAVVSGHLRVDLGLIMATNICRDTVGSLITK